MNGRRRFLASILVGVVWLLVPGLGEAGPRERRHRRRLRRRRRRIRRRVAWRVLGPRRLLVVPVAVAAGWELDIGRRIVFVQEVHPDYVIVKHTSGATEKIEVVKEDTAENTKDLEGSEVEEDGEED
jgi:bifunctional DNA-binding transcriptional regulator/antitoxin component of YhaV-PrlF toxin-antitoxin module